MNEEEQLPAGWHWDQLRAQRLVMSMGSL